MKNKGSLILIAIFIAAGMTALSYFSMYHMPPDNQVISKEYNGFNKQNIIRIKTDTFINLLRRKYGEKVKTQEADHLLLVTLNNVGNRASGFYNNKPELLNMKISDYGFQIQPDTSGKVMEAKFHTDSNQVTVPNDIVLGLMSK